MPDVLFDLSIWSPPYLMNRSYEQDLDKDGWEELMHAMLVEHARVMRPGRFIAVSIADNRSWPDDERTLISITDRHPDGCCTATITEVVSRNRQRIVADDSGARKLTPCSAGGARPALTPWGRSRRTTKNRNLARANNAARSTGRTTPPSPTASPNVTTCDTPSAACCEKRSGIPRPTRDTRPRAGHHWRRNLARRRSRA